MIDVHTHLTFEMFNEDRNEVIQRARDAGVKKMITVATQISSSIDAVNLAKKYNNVYATVGVHPHHADKVEKGWENELTRLAKSEKVVAIGECGLDNYHYHSNGVVEKEKQLEVFERQIFLAKKLNLPLQIHNRLAWNEVKEVVSRNKANLTNPPGLLHCFSGDKKYMRDMLNLGFYIGFDGNITYKNIAKGETTHLKELIKEAPLNRIMTETDSPFLAPVPERGKRNEPSNVIMVGKFIAEQKGITQEELAQIVEENAGKVFKL